MVIRLRVRLKSIRGREVEVVALVGSGYESRRPEILIPANLARELGIYPVLPASAEVIEYVLADGSRTKLIRVRDALEVQVIANGRLNLPVRCDVVIAENAEEVLIGDKLADALGIVAIAMGEGLWCFRDELGKIVRRGVL